MNGHVDPVDNATTDIQRRHSLTDEGERHVTHRNRNTAEWMGLPLEQT
jgi:hypothetical protein